MSADPARSAPLRKEDARLLQGRGRFVDNVHLDRMVHGAFIRSPMAHAEIVSVDASEALAAGALCVLTALDLPFNDKPWVLRHTHPSIRGGMPGFLAIDRVRYVGEPIAFVVATDRYQAEDLAALVNIEYRSLPVVANVDAALSAEAPRLHEKWLGNIAAAFQQRRGDAPAALAAAKHRVRRRFRFARQIPLPLETRGIVADYDQEREALTVWMSVQAHYNVRQNLSSILGLPEYQVRVIAEDVGGGFGSKSRAYPEDIVVSHASRVLRRPVKWIEDRLENFQATTHSRGIDTDLEIGCDGEGRITAIKAAIAVDVGAYVYTSGIITAEMASANLPNAYRIPNFEIDVRCIGTNRTPLATYRGAGQPEATFPMECLLDVLAKQIGISAAELRCRNIVRSTELPYLIGTSVVGLEIGFDSGDFLGMLDSIATASDYTEAVETQAGGDRVAWGLACGIEGGGFVNFETANVRVDTLGNVIVASGMSTQGQGQATTQAQICAETLGVDFDRVAVRLGDTQLMPFGRGAFASRGAIFGGNAVLGAARVLRAKVLDAAAALLKCDAASLTIARGAICRADGETTGLGIGDVARAVAPGGPLYAGQPALEAQYVYKSGQPVTYGLSVHAAKLRLDPRTGFFRVLDYVVVHDAGRALNRMIVEGQVVGGAADGIGGGMYSEIVYDDTGQLLTGTLADYLVATAPEVPRIRLVHRDTPATTNPLGVRGIGEGGVIPSAAALANALARAIDPRQVGHEAPLFELPLKPERVYNACQLARGQRADS
jgi:carbon-monoxide dehydrogenase large subunit